MTDHIPAYIYDGVRIRDKITKLREALPQSVIGSPLPTQEVMHVHCHRSSSTVRKNLKKYFSYRPPAPINIIRTACS